MPTIKRKLKPCIDCLSPSYIFSHGRCKYCAQMANINRMVKASQTLTQTTDGKEAKVFKIAPISKSRAEALKRYRRLRDKYFEEHPVCEFPGCCSKRITLHHKRGRIGAFLTDKRHFCSLCIKHHTWVNENHAEALKLGLVESRLGK